MRNVLVRIFLVSLFLFIPVCLVSAHHVDDISRIPKEKVLGMMDQSDLIIIDSRNTEKYEKASQQIKKAIRLNLMKLGDFMSVTPKDTTLVFYSDDHDEYLSASAALKLLQKGYKNVHALKGGWGGWLKAEYPVEEK
jgi:rhodanese-related sulfurtransferase